MTVQHIFDNAMHYIICKEDDRCDRCIATGKQKCSFLIPTTEPRRALKCQQCPSHWGANFCIADLERLRDVLPISLAGIIDVEQTRRRMNVLRNEIAARNVTASTELPEEEVEEEEEQQEGFEDHHLSDQIDLTTVSGSTANTSPFQASETPHEQENLANSSSPDDTSGIRPRRDRRPAPAPVPEILATIPWKPVARSKTIFPTRQTNRHSIATPAPSSVPSVFQGAFHASTNVEPSESLAPSVTSNFQRNDIDLYLRQHDRSELRYYIDEIVNSAGEGNCEDAFINARRLRRLMDMLRIIDQQEARST